MLKKLSLYFFCDSILARTCAGGNNDLYCLHMRFGIRNQLFKTTPGKWPVLLGLAFWLLWGPPAAAVDGKGLPLEKIKLPDGFQIEIFADNVRNARSLARSPSGVLYVGTRRIGKGRVYAVVDEDNDYKADEVIVLAKGLHLPNGVAFRNGDLYVAEVSRVIKFPQIEKDLHNPPPFEIVNDSFPNKEHHGWKFIRFGPDGRLYVPVGAPCNICNEGDPFATIMSMRADGSDLRIFARGVRNTVGFDWHPQTGDLWFTENGRDHLGNDKPPDELNRAARPGQHFGYPYRHGSNIFDPEFGRLAANFDITIPERELGAHVASLGLRFYNGKMFPEPYRGQVFFAEHGSWNRDEKVGYRISVVTLKNGRAASYATFAEGWLQGEKAWGRPVDVEILPDGSMLVSDDFANVIYRITYRGDGS